MREIRTYGLMRGCWPERFVRRVGVYSTGLTESVLSALGFADSSTAVARLPSGRDGRQHCVRCEVRCWIAGAPLESSMR